MSNKYTVQYVAETLHSKNKNQDFYFLRACLYLDGNLVAKGIPIIWLTKEQYDAYTSK